MTNPPNQLKADPVRGGSGDSRSHPLELGTGSKQQANYSGISNCAGST
jgi:hypothetical protein